MVLLYNTPLLMVLVFLVLTLVVGLYVTQKATTFREYAVGNKRFGTTTLVVTVLAMAFGGGCLMREMPNVYGLGLHHIVFLFGVIPVCYWSISLLGLHMGPFMGHLSVAETIGSVYGKYPRAIAALLGICFSTGVLAIQISVMSSAIGMCIGSIDPRIVTLLATLILITYAMLGGVRAITITDILQLATFTVIIPLLIKFVFVKTGKSFLEVILLLQKQEKFQFRTLFQFDKKLLQLVCYTLFAPFWLSPSLLQRVYMASGPIQAHKAFLRVMLCTVIIMGCIISMGLLVFVWDPTLQKTEIWPYILAAMSPAYKGCVVIGLVGMTMSTVDSNLHTAAIMASHDVVESIRGVKTGSCMHQIRLAKLTALVLGLLAMLLTVYYPDLFQLSHFVFIILIPFFIAAVIPPFILAVFGFRGSAYTALIGMTVGILVYLVFLKWFKPAIDIGMDIIALPANGLAMMAAHYLLPQPDSKGWIGKNDQQKRMEQLIRAFKKYKKRIDLE